MRGMLLALLIGVFGVLASEAEPPNVLLIISDDFGWADLSVNNPDCFYDTPALDRLAREGASFTQAYATNPVCSPSRVSLMTGRYPTHTDTTTWFWTQPHRSENFKTAPYTNQLPLGETTIGEIMTAAGYQTMFVGKWHLGHERDRWPDRRGFEIGLAASGVGSPGGAGYFAPFAKAIPDVDGLPEGTYLPEVLTDMVLEQLKRRDERPFFVTLSYYAVHTPLQGEAELVEKYKERRWALGIAEDDRFADEEQAWDRVLEKQPTRPVRVRQDHAVYGAMVEGMDREIGRILEYLEAEGLADDTVVMFTSDHGGLSTAEGSPTSNLPLRGGKGWIYEGGLRVPLLVRWPGVARAGSRVETPSIGNDVFATIVDAAGVELPANVEGRSLQEALLTPDFAVEREPFFWHYPHYANQGGFPAAAVRVGDWKLIQRLEDGRMHLFDLAADIGEQHDVAAEHPSVVSDMTARLHAWQQASDVKFLRRKGPDGAEPWRPAYTKPRNAVGD